MENDLESYLEDFRNEEKELFDDDGYRFTGTGMSDRQAETMLRLINELEIALRRAEEREQINDEALLETFAPNKAETTEIIQFLMTYGMIHEVKGVSYPKGTHGEFINRAKSWLETNRNCF